MQLKQQLIELEIYKKAYEEMSIWLAEATTVPSDIEKHIIRLRERFLEDAKKGLVE